MSRPTIALSVAALLALLPATRPMPHRAPLRMDLKSAIDSVLDRRIATDSFSGVVLVARDGRIEYERAAGVADRERGEPMTMGSRMQIASATKLFTHIAIRQLEQAGKLALTDTIGKFLPSHPNSAVRSRVTIEQLLRHRSGVGSYWNERYMARRADVRTVNDYLELFQNDSLLFEPGAKEAYSNGGYVLLGAVIERLSGVSYHDYLRQHVFSPAGMSETVPYDRRSPVKHAAVGYTSQPVGGPMLGDRRLAGGGELRGVVRAGERRPNTSIQPGMSGPAGDHYSTAGDLLRLASALTSRRLLDAEHTDALLGARYASGGEFRANGGGPGVNAELSIYPSGDVMVVLSNYDPPSATVVATHIRALLTAARATPAEAAHR